MSRRRTHDEAVRNRLITIRVTEAQYARLRLHAEQQGKTISGMAEALVTKGQVVTVNHGGAALDRDTLNELKRLGNNLNQIAHASNAGLPPLITRAANHLHGLLTLIVGHHYFSSRLAEAEAKESANDSSPSHARDEFQRNAELRSP